MVSIISSNIESKRIFPKVGGPGDGNWHQNVFVLYDSQTQKRLSSSTVVELMGDGDPPVWLTNSVWVDGHQNLFYTGGRESE